MTRPGDSVEQAFHAQLPPGRTLAADTNFFEAGLTSVGLAAVLNRLADAEIDLALIDLFRFPTLRELTAELRRRGVRVPDPPSAPVHRLPWDD
jgi:aryl carrier-like protein